MSIIDVFNLRNYCSLIRYNKFNILAFKTLKSNNNPPDLEELWKNFSKQIRRLFSSYKNQGNHSNNNMIYGSPSPRKTAVTIWIVIFLTISLWFMSGFFIVQEGQVAVITRFGKYFNTVFSGFQWRLPYPIENHEIVNISQLRTFEIGFRGSSFNKVPSEALMLTNDENIVDMQFVVQYRLCADGAPNYLFKTRNPDESVRQAAETAMREIVGKKSMDFVLYEGRTLVATEVRSLMQQILDTYKTGIDVSTVAIQNVQPPEQVQAAFDDAVKAGQDRERQINEGQAYANQVVPWTSGQASRINEKAEGYKAKVIGEAQGNAARFASILQEYEKSPKIMRDRMFLESMQEIFSNMKKIVINTKDGSNNMLYLPIDRIDHQKYKIFDESSDSSKTTIFDENKLINNKKTSNGNNNTPSHNRSLR